MKNLKEQLRNLRNRDEVNPDLSWVRNNRQILMTKLKSDQYKYVNNSEDKNDFFQFVHKFSSLTEILVPRKLMAASRYALTLLLIVSISVSGWIGAAAATDNSLPGEMMHGVKRATEEVELAVTSAIAPREKKVEVILKHASERVKEYSLVTDPEQKKVAIDSLKKKIESTNQELDKIKDSAKTESELKEVVKVARVVEEKTEKIIEALSVAVVDANNVIAETVTNINKNETDISSSEKTETNKVDEAVEQVSKLIVNDGQKSLNQAVVEAGALLEKTNTNAMTVLVKESQKVSSTISKNELQEVIEKKIDRLSQDVLVLKTELKNANMTVSNTEAIIKEVKIVAEKSIDSLGGAPIITASNTVITNKTVETTSIPLTTTTGVVTTSTSTISQMDKTIPESILGVPDLNMALEKIQNLLDTKERVSVDILETKKIAKDIVDQAVIVGELVKQAGVLQTVVETRVNTTTPSVSTNTVESALIISTVTTTISGTTTRTINEVLVKPTTP